VPAVLGSSPEELEQASERSATQRGSAPVSLGGGDTKRGMELEKREAG
jgi:hypothetical protein